MKSWKFLFSLLSFFLIVTTVAFSAEAKKRRSTSIQEIEKTRHFLSTGRLSNPTQANIWPLPQIAEEGNQTINIFPSAFRFTCLGISCSSVLTGAFDRYTKYIFFAGNTPQEFKTPNDIFAVNVYANSNPPLDYGVDESYSLAVTFSDATIISNTEWGALRALETFSQLVDWNITSGLYSLNTVPFIASDSPRFSWRGLLIDTSRHFLPLSTIFRTIDAMAFNKMNVLHWHIVDEPSFPLQSVTYPLLSQKGAWIPSAIYNYDAVKQVIEYAYNRGVRVVPEFDTPGHTNSWKYGYPILFPNCTNVRPVFDVTQNYVYTFMTNFLTEMASLFNRDKYFHMGGDEVNTDCWSQDPQITTWMRGHGIANYGELQAYYEKNIEVITQKLGKIPIYWDEVFGQSQKYVLSKNSIINVWNQDQTQVTEAVKAGYRAIYSSSYYLDRQIPDSQQFYFWEDTWKDFYGEDPVDLNANLSPTELARVMGGEASMWGEQVDKFCIDVRIWPRACAVAERFWSSKDVTDVGLALPRLMAQRCRMTRRGISAGPLSPDFCQMPNWDAVN